MRKTIKTKLLFIILILGGCSTTPTFHYLETHPEFSPLVPMNEKSEYQVTWNRSWKPVLYLRAYQGADSYGEGNKYFLSYSLSKGSVKGLKTKEISESDWKRVKGILEQTGFWTYKSNCDEASYSLRRLVSCNDDDTASDEEIMLMDGATITVAASEGNKAKGIYRICPSIADCAPFSALAIEMLSILGLEKKAL